MRFARLFAALVLAATATVAAAATIKPLATSTKPVVRLAADGDRIAWISGSCDTVRIRKLSRRKTVSVGDARVADCGPTVPPLLALAGGRALWVLTSTGNNVYRDVLTGAAGERQKRLSQIVGASSGGDGEYLTDLTGDGATLLYSVVTMTMLDTCVEPGTPCEYFVTGGRVRRVVGRSTRAVPKAPPAIRISAQGHRYAAIVAAHDSASPEPTPDSRVEVREVATGAIVTRVVITGRPLDLALGPSMIAVLTQGSSGRRIELWGVRNGAGGASIAVPTNASDLSISARDVVYRSGRAIHVRDGVTRRDRRVAIARAAPVGLTIEGFRVIWAENTRHGNRIVWVPFD